MEEEELAVAESGASEVVVGVEVEVEGGAQESRRSGSNAGSIPVVVRVVRGASGGRVTEGEGRWTMAIGGSAIGGSSHAKKS